MPDMEDSRPGFLSLQAAATLIPTFNGTNIPVNSFIHKVENVKSLIDPRELPLFASLVRVKVEGKAERHLPRSTTEPVTAILRDLKRAYSSKQDILDIQTAIAHAAQGKNETALEYGTRIEQLVETADEITNDTMRANEAQIMMNNIEESARISFIRGLTDELEIRIGSVQTTTLREAIDRAVNAEKRLRQRNLLKVQTGQSKEPTRSEPNNYKSYPILICEYCNRNGHSIDNCRTKQRENKNCSYCGRVGHTFDECRTRVFENTQKPPNQNPPIQRSSNQNPPNQQDNYPYSQRNPYQPNRSNDRQYQQQDNRPRYQQNHPNPNDRFQRQGAQINYISNEHSYENRRDDYYYEDKSVRETLEQNQAPGNLNHLNGPRDGRADVSTLQNPEQRPHSVGETDLRY